MNTLSTYEQQENLPPHIEASTDAPASLLQALQTALDEGDTTLFSRLPISETVKKFEQVDTLYLDLDGTSLEQGSTVFPPGFTQKIAALQQAGVRIVFVTGKPETEVRALAESVPVGIPLSFIYERAGYRLNKNAAGDSVSQSLLADQESEIAAAALSSVLYAELEEELHRDFGVRMVPAGDGRHQSLVSLDILRGDAPQDYQNHPRYDLKALDPALLSEVKERILALLSERFSGWALTDLGNGNFEVHKSGQTKENGILRTDEFRDSTGIRMAVDDSRNGLSMLRMKDRHDRMMSGVVFNRHTSPEVVDCADVAVAGEATVDVLLQKIIEAKGIGERVYVISNTPPFQKKGGAFVTSIGAPVAISQAVEGTPNSRWFFPSKTPGDFRGEDIQADSMDLLRKMIPVSMTPAQHQSHYGHVANRTLWKASHPDAFDEVQNFPEQDWDQYLLVNRNIAREVEAGINGSSAPTIVWVHDFQVAAVASELRNMYDKRKLKVGFFWHIPFPDSARFIAGMDEDGSARRARQLLGWFSKYDVVGFHSEEYVRHYQQACKTLGVKPARAIVQPISIDVAGISEQARAVAGDPHFRFESSQLNDIFGLTTKTHDRVEVVLNGLERADPIKGSEPRLQALLDLAKDRPELFDGKIIIEGISESRTATDPLYAQYYNRCLRLIERVNDTLSHRETVRQVSTISRRQDVIALLALVDKAMFTSVADGFNMSGPELLVTWNATRDMIQKKRTMFISDQTGFVKSLGENNLSGAVPLAEGPINRESLRRPIEMLLAGQTPEPNYERIGTYFDTFTIQKWVKGNIDAIRNSDVGRMTQISG